MSTGVGWPHQPVLYPYATLITVGIKWSWLWLWLRCTVLWSHCGKDQWVVVTMVECHGDESYCGVRVQQT